VRSAAGLNASGKPRMPIPAPQLSWSVHLTGDRRAELTVIRISDASGVGNGINPVIWGLNFRVDACVFLQEVQQVASIEEL
jgi:hypothetical protein